MLCEDIGQQGCKMCDIIDVDNTVNTCVQRRHMIIGIKFFAY